MATSTFERKIELTNPESVQKLMEIINTEPSKTPLSEHPFSESDRKRGEELLKGAYPTQSCNGQIDEASIIQSFKWI